MGLLLKANARRSEYGDIAEPASSTRLVAAALEKFGRLDSFVASAGMGIYGGILDGCDDDMSLMIDTNFTGTVWGVRSVVPTFLAAGGGDIVRELGPTGPMALLSSTSR